MCQKTVRSNLLTQIWYIYTPPVKHLQLITVSEKSHLNYPNRFLTQLWPANVSQKIYKCIRIVSGNQIWQISDSFILTMFPENVSWYLQKCIRNLSLQIFLKDFWQISRCDTDRFMTHFLVLTHFRDISDFHLTYFWQSSESDSFLIHI